MPDSDATIEKLKTYRPLILATELIGLLHDVGKYREFIDLEERVHVGWGRHSHSLAPFRLHREIAARELGSSKAEYEDVPLTVLQKDVATAVQPYLLDVDLPGLHKALKDLADQLGDQVLLDFVGDGSVVDALLRHQNRAPLEPRTGYENLISDADTLDSSEDRGWANQGYGHLGEENGVLHTPFGHRDPRDIPTDRAKLYAELGTLLHDDLGLPIQVRERMLTMIRGHFERTYADTRVPFNDSTLWNHSYMVASIARTSLATYLLTGDYRQVRVFYINDPKGASDVSAWPSPREVLARLTAITPAVSWILRPRLHTIKPSEGEAREVVELYIDLTTVPPELGDPDGTNVGKWLRAQGVPANRVQTQTYLSRPQILAIQYPGRTFLTQVVRLPDFDGRRTVLDRIRRRIRDLIEFDAPLGNLIFEDVDGIYFLAPHLPNGHSLIPEVEAAIRMVFQEESHGLLQPTVTVAPADLDGRILRLGPAIIKLRQQIIRAPVHTSEAPDPPWVNLWPDPTTGEDSDEVCQVCGKMPADDDLSDYYDDRICEWCNDRRAGSVFVELPESVHGRDQLFNTAIVQLEAGTDSKLELTSVVERDPKTGVHFELVGLPSLEESVEAFAVRNRETEHVWKLSPTTRGQIGRVVHAFEEAGIPVDVAGFPRGKDEPKYIDELMDQNRRVALVVGKIGQFDRWVNGDYIKSTFAVKFDDGQPIDRQPKPASPSRMMRVVETVEEFVRSAAAALADKHPSGIRLVASGSAKSKGTDQSPGHTFVTQPWDPQRLMDFIREAGVEEALAEDLRDLFMADPMFRLAVRHNRLETVGPFASVKGMGPCAEERIFVILERYLRATISANALDDVVDPSRQFTVESGDHKGQEVEVQLDDELPRTVHFDRVKQVYSLADEFTFLIPADAAEDAIDTFKDKFEQQFAKVRGRLTLHLGLIFADAKFPLYTVLEAGNQMLRMFDKQEKTGSVKLVNLYSEVAHGVVASPQNQEQSNDSPPVPIQPNDAENGVLTLNLGTGRPEPDYWYPYVCPSDGSDWLGVVELGKTEPDVGVEASHGLFDFVWLDTSARRYYLMAGEGGQQPHTLFGAQHSPKPYRLDDWARFKYVWQALGDHPSLTDTGLRNLEAILARTFRKWRLSDLERTDWRWAQWEYLVHDALLQELGSGLDGDILQELGQDVKSGLFFDCLELYLYVLKRRLKEASNGT